MKRNCLIPLCLGIALLVSLIMIPPQEGIAASQSTNTKSNKTVEPQFGHVYALATDAAGEVLFLGASTGLFRSADRGRTWNKVEVASKYAELDVTDVAPDPREPKTIYVATNKAGVLKTADGGKSWQNSSSGLGDMSVYGLAVEAIAPFRLYAALRKKGAAIYRSADQGRKWVNADVGPLAEIGHLRSVNIPTGMDGIFLYATTSTGLQRSADCF